MQRKASKRKGSLTKQKKKPTRRSRRLSGLPPLKYDEIPKHITNKRRKRRNVKTPKKRSIIMPSTTNKSKNTTKIDGERDHESDQEQIEGMQYETMLIEEDDESSSNEFHEEEEKATLLDEDEVTPKEVESKIENNYHYIYCKLSVIFLCIFLIYFMGWFNGYILLTSSFVLYSLCRFYLNKIFDEVYIKVNGVNAAFVLLNMIHSNEYRCNEWITFGLFVSHFVDNVYNVYYNNEWLIFGRDAMIIMFLMVFYFVGDNAIDLVFIYSIKSLVIITSDYGVLKDIQINTVTIHFAAWFSIRKILNFYSTDYDFLL